LHHEGHEDELPREARKMDFFVSFVLFVVNLTNLKPHRAAVFHEE
jgi:hypothetical protein